MPPCFVPRLSTQLEFYETLFRVSDASGLPVGHAKVYAQLHAEARLYLQHSAYHVVDSFATFGYIDSMRKPGKA